MDIQTAFDTLACLPAVPQGRGEHPCRGTSQENHGANETGMSQSLPLGLYYCLTATESSSSRRHSTRADWPKLSSTSTRRMRGAPAPGRHLLADPARDVVGQQLGRRIGDRQQAHSSRGKLQKRLR